MMLDSIGGVIMDDYILESYITLSFFKVSSDNKVLKNQKYELASIEGEGTGKYLELKEDGRYSIKDSNTENNDTSFVIPILPNAIKAVLSSINTREEALALGTTYGNFFRTSTYNGDRISVNFYIPVRLKHINGEPGYKKNDIIFKAPVNVNYTYDNSNQITYKRMYFSIWNMDNGYIYGHEVTAGNSVTDLSTLSYTSFNREESACLYTNAGLIITDYARCTTSEPYGSGVYYSVPYFVDEEGTVKFEIENTVNGLAKYNASKEKKLEYKINVKNVGNASCDSNVITTSVPKEVTVDEKAISDSGVYNKKDNTITWNVDLIEIDEALTFTYNATAPEGVNGKELVGNSSITCGQVAGAAQSNNTIVTLDKVVEVIKNPDTHTMVYIANTNIGMPLSFLLTLLLLLSVILLVIAKKANKFKKTL